MTLFRFPAFKAANQSFQNVAKYNAQTININNKLTTCLQDILE